MKYHNITHNDMLNGEGIRVILWVAGCNHHCINCHNPETHDPESGIEFDVKASKEIFEELEKDYISGITFTGGDPLHPNNRKDVGLLCYEIKQKFKDKTIWLYTGYDFEEISDLPLLHFIDVLVDGKFEQHLEDINYPWAGSTNQRVIDVKETLKKGKVVLYEYY